MISGARICVGLLIFVALLGGIFWWLDAQHDEPEKVALSQEISLARELAQVPVLLREEISLSDQASKLTVDVHYPKVLLVDHSRYAEEASDVIRGFVDTIIDDFTRMAKEASANELPAGRGAASDLTQRYSPLLLSPTIISLRFDVSEYYSGAAHPNNYARTLNYHFADQQVISPVDLFASSSQALPFLSEYTRRALRQTFSDLTDAEFTQGVFPGTAPTLENFKGVGITKVGLIVIFNPYRVAAYARGISQVKIPLSDLEGLLSPDVVEAIRMASNNIVEAQPTE